MLTVYSKPGCHQCKMLKGFLDKVKIEYTDKDVTIDSEAMDFVKNSGETQLPVVAIADTVVKFESFTDLLSFK